MPRKPKARSSELFQQLPLDFDTVINSAQVLSREEVAAKSNLGDIRQDYDPVAQTTVYMQRAVQFENAWETTIQKAREALLIVDPRQLYNDFFVDLKNQIEKNSPKSARLADLLEQVAIRGFGMTKQ